jgi:hypothetical protein
MTHLEAIMLIKEQQPQDLSSEQFLALREYFEQHPESSSLLGGQEQVERYLATAAAVVEEAAADSPPESPETPPLPSPEPTAWWTRRTPRVAIGIAVLACLGVGIWATMAPRNQDSAAAPSSPPSEQTATAANHKLSAARLADSSDQTPDGQEKSSKVANRWRQWTVSPTKQGPWELEREWDLTDPSNPQPIEYLHTGGGTRENVTLASQQEINAARWLRLRLFVPPGGNTPGRIEVRADQQTLARFELPPSDPQSAVHQSTVESIYLVPLPPARRGRVKLTVVFSPGDAAEPTQWRELSLVETATAAEQGVTVRLLACLFEDHAAPVTMTSLNKAALISKGSAEGVVYLPFQHKALTSDTIYTVQMAEPWDTSPPKVKGTSAGNSGGAHPMQGNTAQINGGRPAAFVGSYWPANSLQNLFRADKLSGTQAGYRMPGDWSNGFAYNESHQGELVTTVSGLALTSYDVYALVMTHAQQTTSSSRAKLGPLDGMRETLIRGVGAGAADRLTGRGVDLSWSIYAHHVGMTPPTSAFSLHVKGSHMYVGAAYIPRSEPAAGPEPATFAAPAVGKSPLFFGPGAKPADQAGTVDAAPYAGKHALHLPVGATLWAHVDNKPIAIREKPSALHSEFRYLRFAVRKSGGGSCQVDVTSTVPAAKPRRYYLGPPDKTPASAVQVGDRPLGEAWTVITRDLVEDFGPLDLIGLQFSIDEGTELYLDHVYLARQVADFEHTGVPRATTAERAQP